MVTCPVCGESAVTTRPIDGEKDAETIEFTSDVYYGPGKICIDRTEGILYAHGEAL